MKRPKLPGLPGRRKQSSGDADESRAPAEGNPAEDEAAAEQPVKDWTPPTAVSPTQPEPGSDAGTPAGGMPTGEEPATAEQPAVAAGDATPDAEPPTGAGDDAEQVSGKRRLPKPSTPSMPRPKPPSEWSDTGLRVGALLFVLLLAGGAGLAGYLIGDGDEVTLDAPRPAPAVVIEEAPAPEEAEEIGFPAFATRNTTRVSGQDPIADAAAVALASFPTGGGVSGPDAVVLAPADDPLAAIAASSLAAESIEAPVLLGQEGSIPGFTAQALQTLAPSGIKRADGAQVIAVGDVEAPSGVEVLRVEGSNTPELAKAIDRQRARLSGLQDPPHILIASLDRPEYAMPAAAWAARSGDPILFAGQNVPKATLDVLERHPEALVYVLGPEEAVGEKAFDKLREVAGRAIRIEGDDPVSSAVAFARFSDGRFGWNINFPGHGFAIASTERPADAAAAAPLATAGKPGPLLVTDSAAELPGPLRSFLLDNKPGYEDDPTQAVYNHVWLIGGPEAISVDAQSQIEELVKLEQVSSGRGRPEFAEPVEPEAEADTQP